MNTSLVDQTKLKVQSYLTELGNPLLDSDGDLSLRNGSTRIFVRVLPMGDDHTIVQVEAPLLLNVPLSPALYEYVATTTWRFGKLAVLPSEDSSDGLVLMSHTLLGTFLDPDELLMTVSLLAGTADDIDDEMQQRFGGSRFHDDD